MTKFVSTLLLVLFLGGYPFGHAELIDNGYGLIYDTELNITWYDAPAVRMTWQEAQTWVTGLNIEGVEGWRLPHALPVNGSNYVWTYSPDGSTDIAHNISAPDSLYPRSAASEMAHLHFNSLGNYALYDVNGVYQPEKAGLVNKGPLVNLQDSWYWSGTDYGPNPNSAVYFGFVHGLQWAGPKDETRYAIAVHDGNVGISVAEVAIDIKPVDDTNTINIKRPKTIPVAILSDPDFDAPSEIDRKNLTFGVTGDENSFISCARKQTDVNGDGLKDLVCTFSASVAGFQCGSTEGILKGQAVDGAPIEGRDLVRIVPCK